ncbi:MAG: hypothetical protein WC180_02840 [Candidatus Paceibacterota bacterium]|jgi:hypothetical protein
MENTPEKLHLVDAFHIDSPRLLVELTNAIPGGEELTLEEADELLHREKYKIKEAKGKFIGIHFCGRINPAPYDEKYGKDSVKIIVEGITKSVWESLVCC